MAALTPRQRAVMALVAAGASNKDIAHSLGISVSTVKGHLQDVFDRLEADNRTHAVAILRDRNAGD